MPAIPHGDHRPARFRSLGRKDGLVDRVVAAIQDQILKGRLAVGTRLPPERDFADRLGVSRTVFREAVRILVTRGLLETRHGVGTTVRAVGREEVVKPLTLFLRTCGQQVNTGHLHRVRLILEVENAALAAEQATESDIASLRAICREMKAAAGDPKEFALKDSEFHRRLAQATYNPLLILLLESIQDLMAEVRMLVASRPGLFERVMPTHTRVVERVAAHDARGARRAMRQHLDMALEIQNELVRNGKT
ncbi:MAG: FadR/GntR family transcriptional regulator [Bryobacteraceae bacterium]